MNLKDTYGAEDSFIQNASWKMVIEGGGGGLI